MAIDSDFTFADNPVNTAARQVPQAPVHEVIQPLAGLLLGDLQEPHRGAVRPPKRLLGHIIYRRKTLFLQNLWEYTQERRPHFKAFATAKWLAAPCRNFVTVSWKLQVPHVSWSSISRPSYWADKIAPACVELVSKRAP